MYKLLLCVRYLRTRYLAFVCIVSVMLGVATLIVVNAVMSGFSTKLKDRLHGLLSDVVVDTDRIDGFDVLDDDPADERPLMRRADRRKIRPARPATAIEAMTPDASRSSPCSSSSYRGQTIVTKPVRLIGIDPEGRAAVGGFAEYLVRQKDAPHAELRPDPGGAASSTSGTRAGRAQDARDVPPTRRSRSRSCRTRTRSREPDDGRRCRRTCPSRSCTASILGYAHRPLPLPRRARAGGRGGGARSRATTSTITTVGGGRSCKPVWGTLPRRRLPQDGDERVRPELRLRAARPAAAASAAWRAACTAFQIKLKNYDQDKELVDGRAARSCSRTPDVAGRDLGGEAGAAAGRHRRRDAAS